MQCGHAPPSRTNEPDEHDVVVTDADSAAETVVIDAADLYSHAGSGDSDSDGDGESAPSRKRACSDGGGESAPPRKRARGDKGPAWPAPPPHLLACSGVPPLPPSYLSPGLQAEVAKRLADRLQLLPGAAYDTLTQALISSVRDVLEHRRVQRKGAHDDYAALGMFHGMLLRLRFAATVGDSRIERCALLEEQVAAMQGQLLLLYTDQLEYQRALDQDAVARVRAAHLQAQVQELQAQAQAQALQVQELQAQAQAQALQVQELQAQVQELQRGKQGAEARARAIYEQTAQMAVQARNAAVKAAQEQASQTAQLRAQLVKANEEQARASLATLAVRGELNRALATCGKLTWELNAARVETAHLNTRLRAAGIAGSGVQHPAVVQPQERPAGEGVPPSVSARGTV